PVANEGALYQGMDGALLYYSSTDGGTTWDHDAELLDGITADEYIGWSGDAYDIQARGDVVAFLAGDSWTDFVLMKSEDAGDTWEKTVIWENPYPFFTPATPPYATDTFYCVDGSHALTIDMSGKVHVTFGINRAHSDGTQTLWFPLVDGLGYWNEDRPTFSNDLNALCPYDDCVYTELEEDYSLIGWAQDINENGEWDILGEVGLYYVSPSGMPTMVIDNQNRIYVVWAGVTEGYDNGLQDYRHLWARASSNGGDWWGGFVDLTSDLVHIFDECVFPSISPNYSDDDFLHLNYQYDTEPGLHVRGDEDPIGENTIGYMQVGKDEIPIGVKEYEQAVFGYDVSQVSPNPVSGAARINVNVRKPVNLSLEVTNMMGQVVMVQEKGDVLAGMNTFEINSSLLSNGVYFCTVKAGENSITRKMIVE
ncbi:MAG: T9SS type A sorting domain-containing protein, partial [Bacteroidales bacterium]|nr:T9SS type A sorting domain-containing protein [Bacteroidales bacterium]